LWANSKARRPAFALPLLLLTTMLRTWLDASVVIMIPPFGAGHMQDARNAMQDGTVATRNICAIKPVVKLHLSTQFEYRQSMRVCFG